MTDPYIANIDRKFYLTGVKEQCAHAGRVVGVLRSVHPPELSTSVSTVGTSAEGLASLITGMDLVARRVSSVGPDSPARHLALENVLLERSARDT